jgi:hypothetical protein
MIFVKRTVKLKPKKSLFLVPFGEVQSEEEYPRLKGLVDWLLTRKREGHEVLMLGMGDYFESPSPSDRAAMHAAKRGFGFYEELARDIMRIYEKRTHEIADILMPLRGHFGGFLRGHHWLEFATHLRADLPPDSNQLLAQLLDGPYLGSTVQLTINVNGLPFRVFASHGYGSARTPGARIAKRLRMRDVVLDAHLYVMGHDNDKVVYPSEALVGREYLKQYFAGSGSFQRAYNFDKTEGTYAEDLLLPPTALGVVIAEVKMKEDKKKLNYHVST